MIGDTIAAISTPLGEGGLAVIRLSGPLSFPIADRIFHPKGRNNLKPSAAPSHTVHYGEIKRGLQIVDEVMLTVLRSPRTFTREDMVEISCHGGLLPAKLVLDAALENGARLSQPGEFTKRAFINGRIDLTQAEAIADLIHSRTELALRAANEQLAGKLSRKINLLRDDLVNVLAHVEAHIDFPEEDIAPDTRDQLLHRLQAGLLFIDELLKTAPEGRILRKGIRAAIIGRPNSGKSSLLNQLLGHERAIVSPIAGTTRDTIEETANIRGLPIIFIDTAGLRESIDLIESEGIRRSHQALEAAEVALQVLDASEPLQGEDEAFLQMAEHKPGLIVFNKIDLPRKLELPTQRRKIVPVSCLTGEGIELLKDEMRDLVWKGRVEAEMVEVMINSRHQEALNRARQGLLNTIATLQSGETLEIAAMELRLAVSAVGEIVGKTSTDDILDSIFSQFCIGK